MVLSILWRKVRIFAVMIAYYENGVGQFGLIYDVMNDTLYSGGGQFDVYMNDQKLPPFQDRPLNRFLVGCNANMFANNYHGLRDMIEQNFGSSCLWRCWYQYGSCYGRTIDGLLFIYSTLGLCRC